MNLHLDMPAMSANTTFPPFSPIMTNPIADMAGFLPHRQKYFRDTTAIQPFLIGKSASKSQIALMPKRQFLVLFGLFLMGMAISYLLQSSRVLGLYVGDSGAVTQILEDNRSPEVRNGNSDLTMVVYTDYQCPACRMADAAMHVAVEKDGNVRVIYKDWPVFGEASNRAASVALASRLQGIYPSVHRGFMTSPNLHEAAMREVVEEAGGNWHQLGADVRREQVRINNQLAKNGTEALSLGLAGTPAYLIGPFLIEGALSESEFHRAFEQARARQ